MIFFVLHKMAKKNSRNSTYIKLCLLIKNDFCFLNIIWKHFFLITSDPFLIIVKLIKNNLHKNITIVGAVRPYIKRLHCQLIYNIYIYILRSIQSRDNINLIVNKHGTDV